MQSAIIILIASAAACVLAIIYERREAISQFLDRIIPLPEEQRQLRKRKILRIKLNTVKMDILNKENSCKIILLEIDFLNEKKREIEKGLEDGQANYIGVASDSGNAGGTGEDIQTIASIN